MALLNASEVAEKWAQRAGAASQDYVAGAQRTDKDPTALAIAALPRMRRQILAAIDSGKVTAGLRRSGKQGWLDGITNKGASNYASGVSASKGKVEQAFSSLLGYIAAGQSRLASMPANTDQERDARALFWIQYMRQYTKPGS
jgi:hypothetical protein